MSNKCWVLLNDNGKDSYQQFATSTSAFGPTGFPGPGGGARYATPALTNYIPSIASAAYTQNTTNDLISTVQSRLWAYDVFDNAMYYVSPLTHQGSDIGMGTSTFVVGCQYNLTNVWNGTSSVNRQTLGNPHFTNLTINEYSYEFQNEDFSGFTKTAKKVYRLVNNQGQLLGIGNNATSTVNSTKYPNGKSMLGSDWLSGHNGIGNATAYISDREVLVDDRSGNIWYVNLDSLWMGANVYSSENGLNTSHPTKTAGLSYLDFSSHSYSSSNRTLTDGWYACSYETDYKVYTVVATKIIDLNANGSYAYQANTVNKTQGDLTFIANDPSQGDIPTVAITIKNSSQTSSDGFPHYGNIVIKYPFDTTNIQTVPFAQTPTNCPTCPIGTVAGDSHTAAGSVAIVKEPSTTNYYLIASRQRYLSAINVAAADTSGTIYAPLNVDSTPVPMMYKFWSTGSGGAFLQSQFYLDNQGSGCNFRGGSQPPSCVFPDNYTFNCTINGCESVFSSSTIPPGQYLTLDACTGECRSYSCNTVGYSCTEIPGTGATNTYVDSDDCDEFCVPQWYDCSDTGCITATSISHTYTALTDCQEVCGSHNCTANGCYPQAGTGGTYTNFATCTASCFSYVCGDDGFGNSDCTLFNPPYYGSGGTFTAATLADAYSACTAATATSVCTSWACNFESVAANTDIYVYYDSTSMSFANTKTAHNAMMTWTANMPGWTGNIYHINMSDERWLSWAGIPFQQPTPRGLKDAWSISLTNNGNGYTSSSCPGTNCCPRPIQVTAWGQSQTNGANWYDGWDPAIGNLYISSGGLQGTYQFRGYPPYAGGSFIAPDYTVPVLNVLFTDESDSPLWNAATGGNEFGTTQIYYDVDRVGVNAPSWAAVASNQAEPTPPFTNDYNYYMQIWNTLTLNNGNIANFVYPTKPTNYSSWGSGTKMVFKHQALSVLAAISSGNMDDYINPNNNQPYPQDGLWSAGTAPRRSSQGGASGSVPGICSIADLTQLETQNVYWDSGFGGLDQYGFGANVEFPVINFTLMQTDLENFVTGGSGILATGCTSAATSTNVDFPYTSETACLEICDPKWECTDTGCLLNATGGTYDSYSACTGGTALLPACQSWSCTTVGCETYNSPLGGTGGTYTELNDCQTGCTSWNCVYVPPTMSWSTEACIEYIGTGYTYSAESACTASCTSWRCDQTTPCTEYPNTAQTYSTEVLCTASTECSWYQCQVDGCVLQTATFVSGPDNYLTQQLCLDKCFGWGCLEATISASTNIYAFYDTSSLSLSTVQNAHNSLMSWINSIPSHTGYTYHTAIDDERWLDWGNIVYSGQSVNGLQSWSLPNIANNYQEMQVISWASTLANSAYWYDNQTPTYHPFIPLLGSVTTKGLPPSADTSGNTLIICFIDESNGVTYIDNTAGKYHGHAGVVGSSPQFSGGSSTPDYQPTSAWTKDYTAWTNTYISVTGATGYTDGILTTGNTHGFLYPIESTAIGTNIDNSITFALHGLAAISSGDRIPRDGTWLTTTYPRTAALGGVVGGTPELCGIADLQMLSVTNPYYSGGTGALDQKGWGININFLPFNSLTFQNDVQDYLVAQSSVSAGGAGATCLSAETNWQQSLLYPYSCQTGTLLAGTLGNCCEENCGPRQLLYACTTTGCSLSNAGTMTWDECNNSYNGCISWSCATDTGCHHYNEPNPQMLVHNGLTSAPIGALFPDPVGGTGGTWTDALSCYTYCTSYNCETWYQWYGPLSSWDGCITQVGTGGTYYNELNTVLGNIASYTACTADCKSYECDNPCGTVVYPIPITDPAPSAVNPDTGCTQYSNTGATYSAESACTATCIENWYCYTGDGTTFLANCLNATSTGLQATTFESQITAIASNVTWQAMQFGNLRWDMSGNYFNPSPAISLNLPLPVNPCPAPAGHWARIISVSHSTLGMGIPYYSWSTFIDALNTLSWVTPPLTYSSIWQDVINSAGPHIFCDWEWCECETDDCLIGCIDEAPIPPQSHGPYTSSTAATEVCCTGTTATGTTWSCQTTTQANTCNSYSLIPGPHVTSLTAYDYMAVNLGTSTFSNYKFELTSPPPTTTDCEGPNGGWLLQLTGITLTNSSMAATNYTSWATFIAAAQGMTPPVLGLVVGMPSDMIQIQIWANTDYAASKILYGTTPCICTNSPCDCIELLDGTGAYTSETDCQLICCESGTSWDCQNGQPFAPVACKGKPFIGTWNTVEVLMDHYIINSANTQFGTTRFVRHNPNITGLNPLTWADVQNNMGTTWNWQDCYYETWYQYPGQPPVYEYWPYRYVANISHAYINGGQTYNSWHAFSAAVQTAGVTYTAPLAGFTNAICDKIDDELGGPTGGPGCVIEEFECCRRDGCYCWELFATGGTYTNEPDCLDVCCPPVPMGWECTLPNPPATIGTCNFVPCFPGPNCHSSWAACIIPCTGVTSWECAPGTSQTVGIDSPNCTASMTNASVAMGMAGIEQSNSVVVDWISANHPNIPYNQFYYLSHNTANPIYNQCTYNGYTYRFSSGSYMSVSNSVYYQNPGGAGGPNLAGMTWQDNIDYYNQVHTTLSLPACPTTPCFDISQSRQDVATLIATTCPNYGIGGPTSWEYATSPFLFQGGSHCKCTVTLCDCIEVAGSAGYPTYAACIPPCCGYGHDETYDCTINGCIDPGGGYGFFQGSNALQDCLDVCWEWVCDPNTQISSNCDLPHQLQRLEFYGNLQYIYGAGGYKNLMPRTNIKLGAAWVSGSIVPQNIGPWNGTNPGTIAHTQGDRHWAQSSNEGNVLIDFFGNPGGVDVSGFIVGQVAPYDILVNPFTQVVNMQDTPIAQWIMDTTTVGPESVLTGTSSSPLSSYCDSPNGKWWRPTGIGVVHKTNGGVIISPQGMWTNLLHFIDLNEPTVVTQLGISLTLTYHQRMEELSKKQPYEINAALDIAPSGFGTLEGVLRLYGEPCLC